MSDDDDDDPPPKPVNRTIAIALAVAAVACLCYAAFSQHWLVNAGDDSDGIRINIGLRDVTVCAGSVSQRECITTSMREALGEAPQASPAFGPTGWATFIVCLLGAAALVAAVGLALARRQPQLAITPTTIALLATAAGLITGCVFVATKPGEAGLVGVGVSFWVFGAGAVLGIAGAQMLAKVNRPPDPDLMEDAIDPDQF